MARKNMKWKSNNLTREQSHERARGSDSSSWPCAAVSIFRARQPLGRGSFLYLFIADGLGILVAVALLSCMGNGRPADFANLASMGRIIFLLRSDAHVRVLGAAYAHDGSGQAWVAISKPLHTKRRGQ